MSAKQFIEFKSKGPLADEQVTVRGVPMKHADGRPVTGGEFIPGKVYVVEMPACILQPIDFKVRKPKARKR